MISHVNHILDHYISLKTNKERFNDPRPDTMYLWGDRAAIMFKNNGILETSWGNGIYKWLDIYTVEVSWNGYYHILKMNSDYKQCLAIRKGDLISGITKQCNYNCVISTVKSNITTILLTMTVRVGNKSMIYQNNSEERIALYIKTIRQWLTKTKFHIVVVENSGYKFEELLTELDQYKDRFEIVSFNESTLPESRYLVKITDKGFSEIFSINYAYNHSRLLQLSNFIIKITGRYYIPELEEYLKQYDLDKYDCITQSNTMKCELIGSHIKNFRDIFKCSRDTVHFERVGIEHDYCKRIKKYNNPLICKEFIIEPTIQGSSENIITIL
jgi:hypothetical protein